MGSSGCLNHYITGIVIRIRRTFNNKPALSNDNNDSNRSITKWGPRRGASLHARQRSRFEKIIQNRVRSIPFRHGVTQQLSCQPRIMWTFQEFYPYQRPGCIFELEQWFELFPGLYSNLYVLVPLFKFTVRWIPLYLRLLIDMIQLYKVSLRTFHHIITTTILHLMIVSTFHLEITYEYS